MPYIFLDESGDLGFDFKKKRTSRFFIVTFLFVSDSKRTLEKVVKKTHAELSHAIRRKIGVLHAVNEKSITRQRLLERIAQKNCLIMTIYLDKKKVYSKLRDEKAVLYNYVTNILLDRIYSKKIIPCDRPIELIASRRETNKFLNQNFKEYLDRQVKVKHRGLMTILIKTPAQEKCLQAVDFVSLAIFRKYEYGDPAYYDIVKEKIVEESQLFQ